MASRKRFIDAELFQDEWFIDLEPKYKLAWIFLLTNCGHDGIWKVSQKLLSFNVGENVEIVGLKRAVGNRIVELDDGRLWFIPKFITFQYGNNLSRNNSVLKQFFEMDDRYDLQRYLEVEAPTEPLHRGATVKVKDKDKDKEKVKDKDKKEEVVFHSLQVWIKENLPSVSKMKQQLTYEECDRLLNDFDGELVKDVLEAMENYNGISGKYKSVNRTVRNWIKIRLEKGSNGRKYGVLDHNMEAIKRARQE